MFELFETLDIASLLNLSVTISSLFLAILSIIFVIITIHQNNRVLENSTRPYLSIYADTINSKRLKTYLILKNYGNSPAVISNLSCNQDMKNWSFHSQYPPLVNLDGATINPNQKILYLINTENNKNINTPLEFKIKYTGTKKNFCFFTKHYSETVVINVQAHVDKITIHAKDELISCIQVLCEKLL